MNNERLPPVMDNERLMPGPGSEVVHPPELARSSLRLCWSYCWGARHSRGQASTGTTLTMCFSEAAHRHQFRLAASGLYRPSGYGNSAVPFWQNWLRPRIECTGLSAQRRSRGILGRTRIKRAWASTGRNRGSPDYRYRGPLRGRSSRSASLERAASGPIGWWRRSSRIRARPLHW